MTPQEQRLSLPCRTEHFAAEARSADQMVMKLKHETAELKAALEGSKSDCQHLRQELRVSSPSGIPCLQGESSKEWPMKGQEAKDYCYAVSCRTTAKILRVSQQPALSIGRSSAQH